MLSLVVVVVVVVVIVLVFSGAGAVRPGPVGALGRRRSGLDDARDPLPGVAGKKTIYIYIYIYNTHGKAISPWGRLGSRSSRWGIVYHIQLYYSIT